MKNVFYHGSNQLFDEFDSCKVGDRLTSLGLGHYLTPTLEEAKKYGDYIMMFVVDTSNCLDWDEITESNREKIEKELSNIIPEDRIAGFGKIHKIEVTDNKDGLKIFKELKEKTKNYYHDFAKAQIVDSYQNKIIIEYRESGDLSLANNQQLMTLMNEYHPNLAKHLGFSSSKFSNQLAIYDSSLAKKIGHQTFKNDTLFPKKRIKRNR
jgi:hypothetical protein